MARLIPALVGSVLLASVTFGIGTAQSEVCVADDNETVCPAPVADDSALDPSLAAPAPDLSLATDPALQGDLAVPAVTRTIGPPTVVQPFTGVVAPAAQTEEVVPGRAQPPNPQKLPPGPP